MRNAGGTLVKSGSGTIGDVDELRIVTGSLNDVITVGIQVAARLGDHVLDGGVAAVPLGSAKSKFDALASAFEALWDVLGLNNDPNYHDIYIGGDGHDVVFGGDGPDKLRGGTNIDFMIGGRGDDLFQKEPKSVASLAVEDVMGFRVLPSGSRDTMS
jgi:Ca2+-binding RTX toxin-like protein